MMIQVLLTRKTQPARLIDADYRVRLLRVQG
jgi:hypothetical protein